MCVIRRIRRGCNHRTCKGLRASFGSIYLSKWVSRWPEGSNQTILGLLGLHGICEARRSIVHSLASRTARCPTRKIQIRFPSTSRFAITVIERSHNVPGSEKRHLTNFTLDSLVTFATSRSKRSRNEPSTQKKSRIHDPRKASQVRQEALKLSQRGIGLG